MHRTLQGKYITAATLAEKVEAFVPAPLPPDPPIEWSPELSEKFNSALVAVGRLDGVSAVLPDIGLWLYMYVRKEAVLSSRIEGTQSSLSDLLLFEMDQQPGVPLDDAQEVSNYVAALNHGLARIRGGFPLSLRLIKEIHEILLAKGRGQECDPGEFRRSQNWIGGTRPGNAAFVPPPPSEVLDCMAKLELFLHDTPVKSPTLLKAALAHVQFETIHPFLDGNGRLGRLLITLILCAENLLSQPMLYLSLYFKTHRQRYYELLNEVRLTGDWEAWLDFFADAVYNTASQALATAQSITALTIEDSAKIKNLARISSSALQVHRAMLERPITNAAWVAQSTELSMATVNTCLNELMGLGILKEITGKKRNRLFSYTAYIKVMNEGTLEPPG